MKSKPWRSMALILAFHLRVETTPIRIVSITGGPEDAALAACVDQLRAFFGMGPLSELYVAAAPEVQGD